MKLQRFDEPNQFYQKVKDYLLKYEAHHCLPLGIIDTLINHPERYNCQPYLASVEVEGNAVAVAMRTPPYNLLLSKTTDFGALEAIAQDLHLQKEKLPGVSSFTKESETFARIWQSLSGESYRIKTQMRIHQLEKVEPIALSNGYMRLATERDRNLLINWYEAFLMEAMGEIYDDSARFIDYKLKNNCLYLWEDGVPVSMVGYARGGTPNGKPIAPVYTPPEYRKKGYATSCVATLSQQLLQENSRYCFLFTDLSNPTSNHIYQTIGYQPVCDWNEYRFE
ncbi:MAG TPA: GNAT family N-acetyltransferase [Leptolyngbyaceae cyanobacterium]